ncbi:MAG: M28 family peptidase [Bacteroidetes bacterium]|nr:M28 family peptidase [Bacteroidota bacterium]MCL1969618.1 M28 family peptidase [Bacteroidota bacterium]
MKKLLILFFMLFLFIISCNDSKQNKPVAKEEQVAIVFPNFDADSAFNFVKAQTDCGPRVPNTDAHKQCAQLLQNKLEQYCDKVLVQSFVTHTFDGTKINCKNIIGSFSPEEPKRILLASHWDSRPFADNDPNPANKDKPIDGANDGASGVGILLEIARQLKEKNPQAGVDIIFFDAEDWGTRSGQNESGDWWCLGAQHWAKNPHIANYEATFGILLDMVGATNATFKQEYYSTYFASPIVRKVWGKAYQLGYKDYFVNTASNPITDDHVYVNRLAKIPMIDIIHQDNTTGTGFPSTWHTLQDNISNIDRHTLYVVGTTLLTVIYGEE